MGTTAAWVLRRRPPTRSCPIEVRRQREETAEEGRTSRCCYAKSETNCVSTTAFCRIRNSSNNKSKSPRFCPAPTINLFIHCLVSSFVSFRMTDRDVVVGNFINYRNILKEEKYHLIN